MMDRAKDSPNFQLKIEEETTCSRYSNIIANMRGRGKGELTQKETTAPKGELLYD